jgi:hypothetical protein
MRHGVGEIARGLDRCDEVRDAIDARSMARSRISQISLADNVVTYIPHFPRRVLGNFHARQA